MVQGRSVTSQVIGVYHARICSVQCAYVGYKHKYIDMLWLILGVEFDE